MAIAYVIKKKAVTGNERRHVVDVTPALAGDYSSGLTIDPKSCGLSSIDFMETMGASTGIQWVQDTTSGKLRGYVNAAGAGLFAEVTGAQAATTTVRVEAIQTVNG